MGNGNMHTEQKSHHRLLRKLQSQCGSIATEIYP